MFLLFCSTYWLKIDYVICWQAKIQLNMLVEQWHLFIYIYYFFSVRLLSVLRGHSVFSSPPQRPMTSDFEGFSIPDFIHYIYFNSWERASIFPFECSVLNQGTTGTIFITYLVWRGPWLGIEPGTSALEARTIPLGSHRFPLKRDLTDITVLCQYRQQLVHMERDNPKWHWSKEVHYSDKTNLYIKIYL